MYADGNVRLRLALESRADFAGGDLFTVAPGERAVVHGKLHLHRRGVDLHERQRLGVLGQCQRVADVHLVKPGQPGDVARSRRGDVVGLQSGELLELDDLRLLLRAVLAQHVDLVALLDVAGQNPADGHPADILIPVDVTDEHPERSLLDDRWRHPFNDRLEQIVHVLARPFECTIGKSHLGAAIEERCVELILIRSQFEEQLQHLVVHPLRARGVTVDLVNHTYRLKPVAKRLAQYPARLRLRSADGIGQQQHAVDHLHHPLDLGAEVGVARCVDDVDGVVLPIDRRILGFDRDAFFALKIHRVHDPLSHHLIVPERATLLQQLVHQRGFAVIHVCDNRNISNMVCLHKDCGGDENSRRKWRQRKRLRTP